MEKSKVIAALRERALEQQVLQNIPFPQFFLFLTHLLGENPWKIILPVSVVLTLFFHLLWGRTYDEFILWLFSYL